MQLDIPTLKCVICKHTWHPRRPSTPQVCPVCKRRGCVVEYNPNSRDLTTPTRDLLEKNGFDVDTEMYMGGYSDIVATRGTLVWVIEIKSSNKCNDMTNALGQLLYYETFVDVDKDVTKFLLTYQPIEDDTIIRLLTKYNIIHKTVSEFAVFVNASQ